MNAELFTPTASRLRPRLLLLARQYDAVAAEDAVQEAMMRLWKVWGELPEVADAERLAARLTKHACISAYRKNIRQQPAELSDVPQGSAEDAVRETELRQALDRAVAALPPAERRLWDMFSEAGMDRVQISAATGIAVRSVSSMLSSARRRIMESLKKGGAL